MRMHAFAHEPTPSIQTSHHQPPPLPTSTNNTQITITPQQRVPPLAPTPTTATATTIKTPAVPAAVHVDTDATAVVNTTCVFCVCGLFDLHTTHTHTHAYGTHTRTPTPTHVNTYTHIHLYHPSTHPRLYPVSRFIPTRAFTQTAQPSPIQSTHAHLPVSYNHLMNDPHVHIHVPTLSYPNRPSHAIFIHASQCNTYLHIILLYTTIPIQSMTCINHTHLLRHDTINPTPSPRLHTSRPLPPHPISARIRHDAPTQYN